MSDYCNTNQRIQEELDELYDTFNKILLVSLPEVSTEDNGKFLRVVNGAWNKVSVPFAEQNEF